MILIVLILACFGLNAGEVHSIKFNSDKDEEEVRLIFKDLFFNQSLAYSLFGNKPISFSDRLLFKHSQVDLLKILSIDGYFQSLLQPYCEPSSFLKNRWEIWKKYKGHLKSKGYNLIQKRIGKYDRILIINRKSFIDVFNQNIDLFQKILNPNLTAENLLEQIEDENTNLFDNLKQNQGLLGILLGFGRHNSMLFQKREKFLYALKLPLKSHECIQRKIDILNKKLELLHKHDSFLIATDNRVGFVADYNHPETIELRNIYDEMNRKITDIYSQEDWFEKTLLKLEFDPIFTNDMPYK